MEIQRCPECKEPLPEDNKLNLYPRMAAMLRYIEEEADNCPSCGNYVWGDDNRHDHKPDCELAAILTELEDKE